MKDKLASWPAIIAHEVPAFLQSPELKGLHPEDNSPYWIATAFAKYFARLQHAETLGSLPVAERYDLRRCYQAIERLGSSDDIEVINSVTVFIFESVDDDKVSDELLRSRLGPNSLKIFLTWGRGVGNDGFGRPIVKGGP